MADKNVPCVDAEPGTPHATRPTTAAGPRSPYLCATCRRARSKATRASRAAKRVETVYGLSPADLDALRAALPLNAKGVPVCPGCLRATGATKALAVDHDHALERAGLPIRETVRGLLSGPCNQVIGRYGPKQLLGLLLYVLDPPAFTVLGTHPEHPSIVGRLADAIGGDDPLMAVSRVLDVLAGD